MGASDRPTTAERLRERIEQATPERFWPDIGVWGLTDQARRDLELAGILYAVAPLVAAVLEARHRSDVEALARLAALEFALDRELGVEHGE